MTPFFCRWLWHAATLLCDGTITCGLDDPFKLRDYGNIKTSTLREILECAAIKERRHSLIRGHDCGVCHLHTPIDHVNISQLSPSTPYPSKLVVESSIRCNIRCNNSVCNMANDATFHIRTGDYLHFDVFKKALDEIGPHLNDLFFFNYGEPFINPKSIDMLKYAKQINPAICITSSTNGLLLAKGDMAEQIVEHGLVDWLCFTIGGCDEESYSKYHKSSSFQKAIEGMRKIMEAKKALGRHRPIVHWRYLLFNWNDTDTQIARAQEIAAEIGVDEFKVFMTGTPLEGRSLRRAPGTDGFEAISHLIDYDAHFRVDPFGEAGLWAAEEHGHMGRLAWTGRRARLNALVGTDGLRVRLARPDHFAIPESKVEIKTPWGTYPAEVGNGSWKENRVPPPAGGEYPDEVVSFEVITDRPFSPLRVGMGLDGRELGVMISLDDVTPRPNPYRRHQVSSIGPRLREGCDTPL